MNKSVNKSFAVFVSACQKKWLQMDGWLEGPTDGQTDHWTDIPSWLMTKDMARCWPIPFVQLLLTNNVHPKSKQVNCTIFNICLYLTTDMIFSPQPEENFSLIREKNVN